MEIKMPKPVLLFAFLTIHLYSNVLAEEPVRLSRIEPITPVPEVTGLAPGKVKLGRRLFHDPGLSSDGSVACASCHSLHKAGQDGLKKSIGVNGQTGTRNAPTVLNSSLSFRQFWDGRAASLEQQVSGPLMSPVEMASSWEHVLAYINSDASYRLEFENEYQQAPDRENIANAIAIFERSLLTPDGDFDRFLKGDDSAINAKARAGYQRFKSYGCISCHQGVAVGGNLYQKLGIIVPTKSKDTGRFLITGNKIHKFEFKVPGLRNVARTGPYFHDGSVSTLEKAVKLMAKYQLGRNMPDDHISDIVAFLETLNGVVNGE